MYKACVTVHSTGKEIRAMSRNSLHKISLVATSHGDAFSFERWISCNTDQRKIIVNIVSQRDYRTIET